MHLIKITKEAHNILLTAAGAEHGVKTEGSMHAGLGMFVLSIDNECMEMLNEQRKNDESDSDIIKRVFQS